MKKNIIIGMTMMFAFLVIFGIITLEQYIEEAHIVGISKYGFITE